MTGRDKSEVQKAGKQEIRCRFRCWWLFVCIVLTGFALFATGVWFGLRYATIDNRLPVSLEVASTTTNVLSGEVRFEGRISRNGECSVVVDGREVTYAGGNSNPSMAVNEMGAGDMVRVYGYQHDDGTVSVMDNDAYYISPVLATSSFPQAEIRTSRGAFAGMVGSSCWYGLCRDVVFTNGKGSEVVEVHKGEPISIVIKGGEQRKLQSINAKLFMSASSTSKISKRPVKELFAAKNRVNTIALDADTGSYLLHVSSAWGKTGNVSNSVSYGFWIKIVPDNTKDGNQAMFDAETREYQSIWRSNAGDDERYEALKWLQEHALKKGMSQSIVLELLGSPNYVSSTGEWVYGFSATGWSIAFEDGNIVQISPYES